MARIQIRNIIKNSDLIDQAAFDIVRRSKNPSQIRLENEKIRQFQQMITSLRTAIEKKAKDLGGSPADLPEPSFQAYQWIKFLSQKKWLLVHLHALYEFLKIMGDNHLIQGMGGNRQQIRISIRNSNYLFRSKRSGRAFYLEINEGFIQAPPEIKTALLRAAMGGKRSKNNQLVRAYSKSEVFKQVTNALKSVEKTNQLSSLGRVFDLQSIYEQINHDYFQDALKRPRLTWSARKSKRRMGMYDPASNTITINRILDSKNVPQIALEYILFHEMLHQKLGIKESNGRRYAHTAAFRQAEKKFKGKEIANQAIRKIVQSKF